MSQKEQSEEESEKEAAAQIEDFLARLKADVEANHQLKVLVQKAEAKRRRQKQGGE